MCYSYCIRVSRRCPSPCVPNRTHCFIARICFQPQVRMWGAFAQLGLLWRVVQPEWVSCFQTFWPVGQNFEFPDMVFCSEHATVDRFGNPVEPGKIFRCPPRRTVNLRLILPFIHARLFVRKIHVSFIYVCVSAGPVFNSYIKTFLSEVLGVSLIYIFRSLLVSLSNLSSGLVSG